MGDSRRWDMFSKIISTNFPDRNLRIADVAGGKGYLNLALSGLGYRSVVTFDKRYKRLRSVRYKYGFFSYNESEYFDLIVGMHPDEGTDHIIEYSKKNAVPFVVCPCCVKPSARPYRGQRKFALWMEHLKRLSGGFLLTSTTIKMNGKNEVLIGRPQKAPNFPQKAVDFRRI